MIPGYTTTEELFRSRTRVVYRARRDSDQAPVVLKMLAGDSGSALHHAALKHEYEMIRSMSIPGVPVAMSLESDGTRLILVLEDSGGVTLRSLIDSRKGLDPLLFLKIAIQLARIVGEIHQHKIIHKDINPKNIVINLAAGKVELIDFNISTRLPHENQEVSHPSLLEGTLAYISPEQTGRMNRPVDYRTDLYSLGVTFYEMLLGRLPFLTMDPMELVHCHIARDPRPPIELNPEIPRPLSDIVMKLLSKNAENRYNSCRGLKTDLEFCLRELEANGTIPSFVPGTSEVSDRFNIPQKLYGREEEIQTLMSAFERACHASLEIMMVFGYSGIGKSSLISEIHKPIVRQNGHFISGKFDQLNRIVPYSALIQAFQELIRQILTEDSASIETCRKTLLQALGPNGQIIVDVIPEVELIIGKQPSVPLLGPAESQNRFNFVFQQFIGAFAKPEHPLVFFLDDLQWADSATLTLLHLIGTNPELKHLFLIGAYRDNEVQTNHPLIRTLGEIRKSGIHIHEIALAPLEPDNLTEMVADTLLCTPQQAAPLAELVLSKTAGNPFFVTQFLKSLYQEQFLRFDYERNRWRYELADIRDRQMTDNVVELMAAKIRTLPEDTQRVLKAAACIGNRFDLQTLTSVHEEPGMMADIWPAVQEGLIVPVAGAYALLEEDFSSPLHRKPVVCRFLHDRVQQAAYDLIPADLRKEIHLRLGRFLLQKSDESEREEKLFDITNHFNLGRELLRSEDELRQLAELNLAAGIKAKRASAYRTAETYLDTGRRILPPGAWQLNYSFAFRLHLELAECEYLCSEFEKADEFFELLLQQARDVLDKAAIYNMRIVQYENMAQYHTAAQHGIDGLRMLGINLPGSEDEKKSALQAELALISGLLKDRPIAELIDLPIMSDPVQKACMRLLMTMWAPAYIDNDPNLFVLVSATMVRLSLQHGNTEESAYGYVTHAITAGSGLGDYQSGYEFGRLALAVNEKLHDVKLRSKVHHMFSCFVNPWRQPIRTCFPHSREAYRAGLETGDFTYATYAVFHESWYGFLTGNDLKEFLRDYSPNLAFLRQIKNYSFVDAQQVILDWGAALAPGATSPLDEQAYLEKYRGDAFFMTFFYITRLHHLYAFERYAEARECAASAASVAHALVGTIWPELLTFYTGLVLAADFTSVDEPKLQECREKLRTWADNSPLNFRPHDLLLSAEEARLNDNLESAIRLYDQAILAAKAGGMIQDEALCNEVYGKFWLLRGNERIARVFITEAHHLYSLWGATAKCAQLQKKYADLLNLDALPPGPGTLMTTHARPGALDIVTVIKAAQAISGEIVLERLQQTLMKILIENAGAQRGSLIAGDDLIGEKDYATSIANYVSRTLHSVVLADASVDERYASDPYIQKRQPRSVLCVPILAQAKLRGVLYLENNLTPNAFSPDRIQVAQILATQAAISLENAKLYDDARKTASELRLLNDLIEQTTQPMAVSEMDGRILRFNRAYEGLTGFTHAELREMSYQQLTPESWRDTEQQQLNQLLRTGDSVRYEKEYRRKDGALVPVELVVDVYRNSQGEPLYLYAFITDISERKRAETALVQALQEVEQLKNRLQAENVYLQEEIRSEQNFEEIIGASPALKKVFQQIERVARTDSTVLITGETGTGKELVARAIHNLSSRKESPLIKVNCAALPSGLIESELFGHEKGAFTGATTRKKGRFELADEGSLLLDEVGELPLETQIKLLRVLQEQEFERLGGAQTLKVNVRVIAATNRELQEQVKRGAFRDDLYYRLNIFPIHIPALRDRKEDIPLLASYFVTKFARRMGKRIDRISADALRYLSDYGWPGNVRELANVLERAAILCDGGMLQAEHVGLTSALPQEEKQDVQTIQDAERGHILRALQKTGWVVGGNEGAAKLLGLKRTTLIARMKKLGIEKGKP